MWYFKHTEVGVGRARGNSRGSFAFRTGKKREEKIIEEKTRQGRGRKEIFYLTTRQRCQLIRFIRKPYGFLRFARAYGHTMQFLRIFMILADSKLKSFHALYSNCCQFAVTPDMLREHESK